MKVAYSQVAPYVTLDGSEIRELMHPARHGNQQQSFAEAIVEPGQCTALHRHRSSEEIYHVTAGAGEMTLGDKIFEVTAGDTVLIPPGVGHRISNTGSEPLKLLCCCSPPYSHQDTELI